MSSQQVAADDGDGVVTVREGQVWKVGQLAKLTGLTARTLHHDDHLGLMKPSARTAAGYRLYDEADIERLYRVLALRQLGLPLESVGAVLDGQTSIAELLQRHQAHVDRQLIAARTLRAQLSTMTTLSQGAGSGSVTDFLELIRKVITVDDTVRKYFSDEQLAELAERREQVGEQAIADVEAAWPPLIERVQAAVDMGLDPATPQAQELAAEWMQLLQQFHGGDAGLRDSLYRMQSENAEQIEQQHAGPSPVLMDFIKAAADAARA